MFLLFVLINTETEIISCIILIFRYVAYFKIGNNVSLISCSVQDMKKKYYVNSFYTSKFMYSKIISCKWILKNNTKNIDWCDGACTIAGFCCH